MSVFEPNRESRVRYATAYPPAGGFKATNSRPKAGIAVREKVCENRMIPKTNLSLTDDGLVSVTGWIVGAGWLMMVGREFLD